jgi:DNA polymerase III alpha subunit
MLDKPPHDLGDNIPLMAQNEERYMGCSLTCSQTDAVDINISSSLCRDIIKGAITGKTNVVAQVSSVREYRTKRGKNPGQLMAFLCIEDSSGSLDSVIFPESYGKYRDLLIEGNTVLLVGEISKKENTSLIINKVSQL